MADKSGGSKKDGGADKGGGSKGSRDGGNSRGSGSMGGRGHERLWGRRKRRLLSSAGQARPNA